MAGLQQLNWDSEGVGSKAAALVDLSTVAGNKISNPPWVKFQSAGWVNFPSAPTLISTIDVSSLPKREALEATAQENAFRIARDAPWIVNAGEMAAEIGDQKGSLKAKYMRLRKLGDRIAEAIGPHSACQKTCSHCCHIAVAIHEVEADIIAEATGRKRTQSPSGEPVGELANRYFRQPCPFLKQNACSIYNSRPMACRLHFSISGTNAMCDTRIAPVDSTAINLNLNDFWFGYMSVMHVSPMEDVRHYFPNPQTRK
ncbi:YkgJ family cysteine cluster protein [Pseudomonas aeruginosa]|uniref:YkgJ family cysteine cluster protein n=1 Tax=Pseudomonas aeruginosa TaxID=287 RepID=UPI0023A97CC7|nr:YkgJ family cysteine cluster protein [Pseudomonas aeruginosa]MDE5270256.1 YkgJ family cysteine cluster protein [Pseudomonas aeruginosa]MDE5282825.1 YkgJ family cysteine cluster protein [Pseudomonas aeruginosa]